MEKFYENLIRIDVNINLEENFGKFQNQNFLYIFSTFFHSSQKFCQIFLQFFIKIFSIFLSNLLHDLFLFSINTSMKILEKFRDNFEKVAENLLRWDVNIMRCYPKVPGQTLSSEKETRYWRAVIDGTSFMPNKVILLPGYKFLKWGKN